MVDDDPGWRFSWGTFLWMLVPRGLHLQLRKTDNSGADGLLVLRQVFMSFCVALVAISGVVALLYSSSEKKPHPATSLAIGLLVIGAVGILVGVRFEKPLDCTDDIRLALSYRQRLFLRLAFSEAAALLGFIGFLQTHLWWPFPVGLAMAAVGFARAAPTAKHLGHDQEELALRQCGRSLIAAIRQTRPPSGRTTR